MKARYLLLEYWDIKCDRRRAEIDEAIQHNLNLNFDLVYINYTGNQKLPFASRSNVRLMSEDRLTFAHYLKLVNDVDKRGAILVLTNADIRLDPRLIEVQTIPDHVIYALTRYENSDVLYSAGEFSQDTWVMAGQDIPLGAILQSQLNLGVPGCENRFAEIMWSSGYILINPSLTFKNYHTQKIESVYADDYRIYGCYRTVPPCKIDAPYQDGKLVYFHRKNDRPFLIL